MFFESFGEKIQPVCDAVSVPSAFHKKSYFGIQRLDGIPHLVSLGRSLGISVSPKNYSAIGLIL